MRFIFKTDYVQDIRLVKHGGQMFWYGTLLLLLIAAPWVIPEYWLAQLTFVLIYSIVGLGLMLLAGFTGLFSLGHAAFLGVGAYTQAALTQWGVPFPLALAAAGLLSAAVGMVVGLPALRVKGIYLGIATLAFGFIVEEVFARWESVTGGNAGTHLKAPDLFGWKLDTGESFYGLCLVITVLTTSQPNVLAVQASNPATTLPEFVTWARQQGNKLSYGSVGNGSSSHLTMELLKSVAGFDAVHVPYAGSPPAATSLVAGDTQALFAVAPALLPLVQGGRLKFLASTSAQRVEGMKDLPTIAESGYAGFEALAWNGLFAPSGTPVDVVSRINADVNAVLAEPAVRDSFIKQGLIPGSGSSADFKAFIETEARKWGAIIERVGIKID